MMGVFDLHVSRYLTMKLGTIDCYTLVPMQTEKSLPNAYFIDIIHDCKILYNQTKSESTIESRYRDTLVTFLAHCSIEIFG